jgi:hypothetical protein
MNHAGTKALVGAAFIGMTAYSGLAAAVTVPYPYVDVIQQGSDTGVVASGTGPTVTMQGTAVSIINGPGSVTNLAPPATFTLTANYSAALTAADGKPNTYDYTNGTITIGNAGSPTLLTATFADLVLQSSGTSLFNYVIASSPLVYTGGSLVGTLTSGEIVGSFTVTSASATTSQGYAILSQAFAGNNLTAKVGAVVPLPATAWLLLWGMGGLGALSRRRPLTPA